LQAFPQSRVLQIFLTITLYNTHQYREALELALVNLVEMTCDERLQYFKRLILYYATHLDETWE
jgi:hypothetical protein